MELILRSLSVRDILKALPQFKNEIDIINPANDAAVFAVLDEVGFDSRRGIEYIVANHRDMANKTGVGYIAVGEYNVDRKYNKFIDTTDLVIISGMSDISMGKELAILMGKRFSYNNKDEYDIGPKKKPVADARYYSEDELLELGYTTGDEEDGYDDVQDSCEVITSQIRALEEIKLAVRGE